jgi:signal transduction histidine kinase
VTLVALRAAPPAALGPAVRVAVGLVLALGGSAVATAYAGAGATTSAVVLAVAVGVFAIVGAVVTLAAPANRVGPMLLAGAALWGLGDGLTEAGVTGVITDRGSVPWAAAWATIGPPLRGAGWILAVAVVPAIFPDGRVAGPRWRWLLPTGYAAIGLLGVGMVLSPHPQEDRLDAWRSPLALPGRLGDAAAAMSALSLLVAGAVVIAAAAALVGRWRRGAPLVRQQLLLFALACAAPAGVLLYVFFVGSVPPWVFGAAVVPLPVAIGVATLVHGLYDLRRAAHRTLLWLTMSAVVVGIYAAVLLLTSAVAPADGPWWPPAVAAGLVAVLLAPLREALQRAVTRLVYGRWREPYDVLAGLGERLAAAADVDRILDATVTELTAGLGLRDVAVATADGSLLAGAGPSPVGPGQVGVPLRAYGLDVGMLGYRAPDRPLADAEKRLLHDITHQLGSVLHARALRDQLQHARERLVLAREEERRRLRRDLHDGVGPALAGLTLRAETARALLPPGEQEVAARLTQLTEEIRHVVGDVRQVVEGLRPPALDELGVVTACRQAIERLGDAAGVAAEVCVPTPLPSLPAAVEVAAYRIVVEATTNAIRHAQASRCRTTFAVDGAVLAVRVSDDGRGLRGAPEGNGCATMRERAEELGGTLRVDSGAGGTTVSARLPLVAPSTPW